MSINKLLFREYRVASLASLLIIVAGLAAPAPTHAQFQGSEYCQACHAEEFSDWSASGHPYMLMRGEDAKNRSIPLPAGYTWSNIAWVVGGFGRRALFVDNNGYIITATDGPGNNQFNFLTGTWSDYHAGEVNKPYDCGACHTTNYVESGNQGGLPGMQGTFDAGGVQCEQCHGNNGGEGHPSFDTSRIDDSSAACGTCHHKAAAPDETNAIAAADGFIVNGAQYNELMASPHHNVKCATCHDPHKRSEYSIKENFTCESCHVAIATTYQDNVMADYGVTCIDCHMGPATLSGESLGPYQGDTKTHLFEINTDPAASLFTQTGDFVELDDEGEAGLTLDFACKRCHQTTEMEELARHAKNFHGVERDEQEQLLPELHYTGITPGSSGHYWNSSRSGEGFLIDVSYRPNGRILVVVSFYTYDSQGGQTWLVGAKTIDPGVNVTTVNLTIPEGAMWGPNFDPNDLPTPRTPWGTLEFMSETCGVVTAVATPNAEMQALGFVEYTYNLTRDISISGIACPRMLNDPAILTQ